MKIMLSAYSSFNVGDDLFIKIICERYNNVEFYLIAPKGYNHLFKNINNLHIINSQNYINKFVNKMLKVFSKKQSLLLYLVRKMDFVVIIGGSLFIEQEQWNERFELKIKEIYPEKKVFLLGANFGPYHSTKFYDSFKSAFRLYEDVCFREDYSYKLFSDLSNVRKASDIVFNLNVSNINQADNMNEVSISVINFENRESLKEFNEEYVKKITEICVFFQRKSIKVNLVSFCADEGDEQVVKTINRALSNLGYDLCNEVLYKNEFNNIFDTFQRSKLIIATRFHAMILGWVFNKNTIPIIYSDKTKNVIIDSGFTGYHIEMKDIKHIDIDRVYDEYKKDEKFNIEYYKMNSDEQFSILDFYLKAKI